MHIQKYRRNEFVPLMKELITLYHPETYVEIGVAEGYTFNQLVEMPQLKRMVAVDINPMPRVVVESPWAQVEKFIGSSKEFAEGWGDPIDMLFIDGDHSAVAVIEDFKMLAPFVRKGTGLILMHDTHPMTEELLQPQFCNDAWKAVKLVSTKKYEVLTLPGPWAGITIVKPRASHHLCWKGG